ncbi:2399_t:CDS:2 [Diversispora eburnea]|uniref:2399_t:CDS:1 n=1 Tax=Diversispora eburnea TaxID=1213867 RepID=A0A9N8YT22_9GLOM|nr:2399_t:CDS:2 [Diversispora eburnea]
MTGTSALICHMKNTKCKKYIKVNKLQQTLQLSTSSLLQFKVINEKTTCENCKDIVKDFKLKVHMIIQEASGHLSYITNL